MSREKQLLKNTAILMVAKISTQIVSFLLLPLYTAILTTAEYGEVDVYTSLSMIIIPIVTLQLEQGMFRFMVTAKSRREMTNHITTGLALSLLGILVASLVYIVINVFLHQKYALLLYLYYLSLALATIMYQIVRGFGKNGVYGLGSFIATALALVLNVAFVAGLRIGVSGMLWSSIIANFVAALYMMAAVRLPRYIRRKGWNKVCAAELLRYSVPLVFNQVSSWAINYSNRLIILAYMGMAANGIFSLASKFSNLLSTFFNVFNIAWTENVVKAMLDKDHAAYSRRIITLTLQIYLCVITAIINLLPLVFGIFINAAYADAYNYIPLLLIAMFFSGMAAMLGSVYIAHKKTKAVGGSTFIAGAVNVIIHLALIKWSGLYAASIATLLSFLVLFIYRYIDMRKFEKISIRAFDALLPFGILLLSSWAYYSKNTVFVIVGFILNICYFVWLFIRNRTKLIHMLKNK